MEKLMTKWPAAVAALLSAIPILVAIVLPRHLNDDAYITLNYATNLAEGRGFVFNHGPASFGTTTPLFTLLMAGFHWVLPGVPLDAAAKFFSAICTSTLPWILILWRRLWRLSLVDAVIVSAVLILFANYIALGMEAYLFQFLLLLTCACFFAKRYWAAGVLTGLLALTRGEGILLAGVIPVWLLAAHRKTFISTPGNVIVPLLKMATGGTIAILPWTMYAYMTFGRVLPNTLGAKLAQIANGSPQFETMLIVRLTEWGSYTPGLPWLTWIYHLLALSGLLCLIRFRHPLLLPVLWALVYTAAYASLPIPFYWWYEFPAYNGWLLCIGVSLAAVMRWARAQRVAGRSWPGAGGRVFVVAIVLCMAVQCVSETVRYQGYKKTDAYLAVCGWFEANTDPEDVIAASEVGYFGYFLPNPILDLWGLTTPSNVPYVEAGKPDEGLWANAADYYVGFDNDPAWEFLHKSARFQANFSAVATMPYDTRWGRCVIYKRDEPAPAAVGQGAIQRPAAQAHVGQPR
ncbi:MAG: DUF2029 domain-containing protein [Candidatus Hydrogenedentes bacterium]|nr:DUF2029 domain-containing protein [Candidatus Hydrogenedentota bacterium]